MVLADSCNFTRVHGARQIRLLISAPLAHGLIQLAVPDYRKTGIRLHSLLGKTYLSDRPLLLFITDFYRSALNHRYIANVTGLETNHVRSLLTIELLSSNPCCAA